MKKKACDMVEGMKHRSEKSEKTKIPKPKAKSKKAMEVTKGNMAKMVKMK